MSACTTIQQQVYCLAIKICAASTQTGDPASLTTYLQSQLQNLLDDPDFNNGDDWQIVWGPAIWQAPFSDFSDQAAAVCYNSSQNVYVVPVSATNPNAPYNVFFEDLAAVPHYMVPVGGNAGNVTVGNFAGLQALLSLEANGTGLQDFLGKTANASDTLVFCGHSLGGGLTPLLAYRLYPEGTSGSGWGNVYTYPTAGPTTADAGFASAFNAAYPVTAAGNAPYQMWNANQYNAHDLVPNAWAEGSSAPGLEQITSGVLPWTTAMYYTDVTMSAEIAALRNIAEVFAGGSANPYVATNNNALFTGARQYGRIEDSTTLAEEILYQHTTAYNVEFGVTALFDDATMRATIQPPLMPLVLGVRGVGAAVAAANAAAAAEAETAPA